MMAEQPCIHCGECAAACPHNLYPQRVLAALRQADTDAALDLGLDACIACGRCDAACPSEIPLQTCFLQAQAEVKQEQARQQFAADSRTRYQTRLARLERDKQEQADVRQSKRANHAAAAAITAALARAKARHHPNDDSP